MNKLLCWILTGWFQDPDGHEKKGAKVKQINKSIKKGRFFGTSSTCQKLKYLLLMTTDSCSESLSQGLGKRTQEKDQDLLHRLAYIRETLGAINGGEDCRT